MSVTRTCPTCLKPLDVSGGCTPLSSPGCWLVTHRYVKGQGWAAPQEEGTPSTARTAPEEPDAQHSQDCPRGTGRLMFCVCGHWKDEHGYYDASGDWVSTKECSLCECSTFDYDGGAA